MEFIDLVGKTIISAKQLRIDTTDDCGFLLLEFDDGTSCYVESFYGGFTGESDDEYPTGIRIMDPNDEYDRKTIEKLVEAN